MKETSGQERQTSRHRQTETVRESNNDLSFGRMDRCSQASVLTKGSNLVSDGPLRALNIKRNGKRKKTNTTQRGKESETRVTRQQKENLGKGGEAQITCCRYPLCGSEKRVM